MEFRPYPESPNIVENLINAQIEPNKIKPNKIETKKIEPNKIEPNEIEPNKIETKKIDKVDTVVSPRLDNILPELSNNDDLGE